MLTVKNSSWLPPVCVKYYDKTIEVISVGRNRINFKLYIEDTYGITPDYPWESNPTFTVYRHTNNRKWFALVMDIPKAKLGLREDGKIDIVNLKCAPALIGSLRMEKGFFPAYDNANITFRNSISNKVGNSILSCYTVRQSIGTTYIPSFLL